MLPLHYSIFFLTIFLYGVSGTESDITKFTVQMIGYSPKKNDDYVAVSRMAIPGYIVGFEPLANADRVHHMLLYGCTTPYADQFWEGMNTCGRGGSHILFAWARNAPNLDLPKGVSFSIGHENDGIKYFVLQVHYAQPFAGNVKDYSGVTLHISQKPTANLAAVMLFVSGQPIPPGQAQHQNNISCVYESPTDIHPFAFRTHTHAMGRVVSAYNKHNNIWAKIGARNPQWPQLFEEVHDPLTIKNGDIMAASCRFDSHDKTNWVPMGAMGTDEMCNFYMMFYWDSNKENPFPKGAVCGGEQGAFLDYPKEGFETLPPHPEWEHHAHQSSTPFGIIEEFALGKIGDVKIGQVAGLAFQSNGNLIVFHRADRVWNANTFDNYNILLDKTPIRDNVILVLDVSGREPKIVHALGKDKFYLPHGIYCDDDGYVYTTDVGSHTVAKWKFTGGDLDLIWQLGQNLMPGTDLKHFCKPASITREGDILYVADGYCNSRIVKITIDGKILNSFGLPGNGPTQFQLPHDIRVNSKKNLLVADRENGRVQELTTNGEYVQEWASSLFNNIYSVDVLGDYIFMIPGRMSLERQDIEVYAGRGGTGLIEFGFSGISRAFGAPHVLRVDPSGQSVYIGDIAEGKSVLWKFRIQKEGVVAHNAATVASTSPVLTSSSALPALLLIAIIVLGVSFVCVRKIRPSNGGFDRSGFKPVRTEENISFISDDDSDSE
ncbi:unnamed protein product [Auanema sp. JU1783]|nr:unnamed protein product [Auanema sp. JU1783]